MAELSAETHRQRRSEAPLAAVMIDCDDFKRVNETLGHAVGDLVLRDLAKRLSRCLRPTDHLGRVGGDEFLALLPNTTFGEAFRVAERLRLAVSEGEVQLPSGRLHLTASVAVEVLRKEAESLDDVLVATHASLRSSKLGGKNRVSTESDPVHPGDRFVLDRPDGRTG
jgi:diguanylate cyclase (GGDEF)-like protein